MSNKMEAHQLPIVYHTDYNIKFMGLEKLHVFDAKKWGNIVKCLQDAGFISESNIVTPKEANKEELLAVHTKKYLNSLKWSFNVAKIAEMPPLALVPNRLVQSGYLRPMRLQTGGSILAGKLAIECGWAINIGGGFHHCSATKGGGFCPYADITLLIQYLMRDDVIKKAMILDLDAHQGNGYQRDFLDCPAVYIMDVYNYQIYPQDEEASRAIRKKVLLEPHTGDGVYMRKLKRHFKAALSEFDPDILVYNAGTDILQGDPLGILSVSDKGIISRDEFVFLTCKKRHIPIVMLTSGGYLKVTAHIIAQSILNLRDKGIISKELNKSDDNMSSTLT